METSTKRVTTSSHTVPIDVFMDIARILLGAGIEWWVETINDKESSLLIQVSIQQETIKHKKAMENMEAVLSDYGYYRYGTPSECRELIL